MEIFQQMENEAHLMSLSKCNNLRIQNKVDIVAATRHVQFFTKSGPMAGTENAAEKIKIY